MARPVVLWSAPPARTEEPALIRYRSPGYVALTVADLARSRHWYETVLGAAYAGTGTDGGVMFRTGGDAHHSLILHGPGRPGLKRIGWQLEGPDQFEPLIAQLGRHRIPWSEATPAECAIARVDRIVRCIDPVTGATLDFHSRMDPADAAFVPTVAGLRSLCHIGLGTPRYREAIRFYEEVLGFRTSDEIDGRINLMRCFPNPLHHSLAIAAMPRNTLHHLNFMVGGETDLAAARERFRAHAVPVVWDGHHPPSGNTFLFFLDPDGLSLEYGYGMELFPERGARAPRVFPARPESFDSTGSRRDERTAAVGDIECASEPDHASEGGSARAAAVAPGRTRAGEFIRPAAGAARAALRFSVFDWLDDTGRGDQVSYGERLQLLELAERGGFHAYLLAEHHGTSLSTTPSPSVFLAAAAQRTDRLRLGALTWILPLYDPLRLLEELCMLDQLSGGRIELGVGKGSAPHESVRHGVPRDEARERFEEVLALLIMGFTRGQLDFVGRHYRCEGLKTRFRTVQQPYPPIWYPSSSAASMPWAGAQGFNTVVSLLHSPTLAHAAGLLQSWRESFEAHRDDPARLNAHVAEPECAFTTHVYVADSDGRAREEARGAYLHFHDNFTRRYVDAGQAGKYADRPGFDQLIDQGRLLCGSPDTVREGLRSLAETLGANHFIGAFLFGNLELSRMRRSLELFSREVVPAFAEAAKTDTIDGGRRVIIPA